MDAPADQAAAVAAATAPGVAAGQPRPRRAPYRRLPVEQRREQLIAVALELFSRYAPEEVSLDDVALAAEASRPLVYRYFPGGKQQLYEAALRSAADELSSRFTPPAAGGPTERLAHVLDQYFGFVGEHAAGYGALLRGGSVAETERTTAIVDQVRRAAHSSILEQLRVRDPGPRLVLLVRSWISVVETTALTWLDDTRRDGPAGAVPTGAVPPGVGPAAELRDWLVDEFVAMFAVSALHDAQVARVLRSMLVGPGAEAGAELVARLGPLLGGAGPAGT